MTGRIFIGMGSNCEPESRLAAAAALLAQLLREPIFSPCYRSPSRSEGADYLNMAATGLTDLEPGELKKRLRVMEQSLGRRRDQKGCCALDLDILWHPGCGGAEPLIHRDLGEMAYAAVPVADLAGVLDPGGSGLDGIWAVLPPPEVIASMRRQLTPVPRPVI